MKARAVFTFVVLVTLFGTYRIGNRVAPFKMPQDIHPEEIWHDATITVYNPVCGQCDDTPLVTASSRVIDLDELRDGKIRWCALSRDLLKEFPYGTEIDLFISPGHEYNGKWLVADTMNRRYTNHIDLLTYDRKLGKWEGKYK